MAKKKTTWLSPKKQAELAEKKRRLKKKWTVIIVLLSVLAFLVDAALVTGLVIWLQPADPIYAYIEIENYGKEAHQKDITRSVDLYNNPRKEYK